MSADAPSRQLTLFDSICIIGGVVIGAGIYETAPDIASQVDSSTALIAVWVLGGLISLAGAMCYVELATAYPRDGGDYVFLTKSFGRRVGFLFAWCEFWVVRPGSIGMMAFVLARFADQLLSGTLLSTARTGTNFVIYAGGSIVILTLVNLLGVRTGKTTQNILTVIKVLGLILVIVAGFLAPAADPALTAVAPAASQPTDFSFSLALVLVLFTYGGWNDLTYIAAEVRKPEKNLLWALVLGVTLVAAIYLAVNLACLHALGLEGTRSPTVAADLAGLQFGETGRRAISLLICLSCLGAINGALFAGSRVYYAAGTEHSLVAWLGRWSGQFGSPARALLVQGAVALLWVLVFGYGQGEQGFRSLLAFTSPVFYSFAILISLSVFVLRKKDPQAPRPHRVVLYPLTPIIFSLSCVFMLFSALTYAHFIWSSAESGWSPHAVCAIAVVLAGIGVSLLERKPAS